MTPRAGLASVVLVFAFGGGAEALNFIKLQDWVGEYTMNHDGWQGVLRITETKMDCERPAWCSLALDYWDANQTRYAGRVEKIDGNGQHMVFTIDFRGNPQKFDAYLFGWDRRRMAGTTTWGGSVFGFYAVREP